MAEFKVRGLEELGMKLRTLPDRIQRQILDPAVEAMAVIVENEAEELAPYASGKLRRNISRIRGRAQKDKVLWRVGVRRRVYYWRFQEMGSARNAAHPYLRPAVSGKAKEALAEFRRIFAANMVKVVGTK